MRKIIYLCFGIVFVLFGCAVPTETPMPTQTPLPTATVVPVEGGALKNSIVYTDAASGETLICVMDFEDGKSHCGQPITTIPSDYKWSPDGKRVAFSSWDSGEKVIELMILDVANLDSARVLVGQDILGPVDLLFSWSADSQKIVFGNSDAGESMADILIVDVVTGEIDNWKANSLRREENPSFSPDGKKIVFVSDRQEGTHSLDKVYVADADGSNLKLLAPQDPDKVMLEHAGPSWSPDGKQIAFYIYNPLGITEGVDGAEDYKNGIYLINADGTNLRLLTEVEELWYNPPSPVWSPDGQWIAYEWSKPNQQKTEEVWWVALKNGEKIHVDIEAAREFAPSWSPDSRYLLLNAIPEESDGFWVLGLDLNSGDIFQVVDSDWASFASWSLK